MACALLFLAAGLWYLRPELGPWPLIPAASGVAIRAFTTRPILRRTPFDWPLLLFVLSAALAAALSVHPDQAWPRFWVFVGSLALFSAVLFTPDHVRLPVGPEREPLSLVLGGLPAIIAFYFLATNDWQRWMGKLAWLALLMGQLTALRLDLPDHLLHPNVAGGLIAGLLPLQLEALFRRRPEGASSRAHTAGSVLLVTLSLAGLLLSLSRGAWLGVIPVTGAWLLWKASDRLAPRLGNNWARRLIFGVLLATAGLASGLILLLTPFGGLMWAAGESRLELWRNSLHLALDTPLTGLGFEHFLIAYASYSKLLHVGYQYHSHNLLLEIWLQQGLLGMAAVGWLLIAIMRQQRVPSRWRTAALASLAVILIHGLVDIPFYGGRGMMIGFIPLALLARAGPPEQPPSPWLMRPALALLGAIAVALLVFLPQGQGLIQANLGALTQTRTELARYQWPEWPLQDALRRSDQIDLTPAISRYHAALAVDPDNVTANRRLGQIELSLGRYDEARTHLQAAYRRAPGQRATRQLLGEALAVTGQVEEAAALWRNLENDQNQLQLRVWWYQSLGSPQQVQWIEEAIRLASSP